MLTDNLLWDRVPSGVLALTISFTGPLSRVVNSRWIILAGQVLCIVANILFVFGDSPDRYWPYIFPAISIGSAGAMLMYTHTKWVPLYRA